MTTGRKKRDREASIHNDNAELHWADVVTKPAIS